jgi:hypothetical protein
VYDVFPEEVLPPDGSPHTAEVLVGVHHNTALRGTGDRDHARMTL